jgi:hypothetical protein
MKLIFLFKPLEMPRNFNAVNLIKRYRFWSKELIEENKSLILRTSHEIMKNPGKKRTETFNNDLKLTGFETNLIIKYVKIYKYLIYKNNITLFIFRVSKSILLDDINEWLHNYWYDILMYIKHYLLKQLGN